jgi:hypothetical protein
MQILSCATLTSAPSHAYIGAGGDGTSPTPATLTTPQERTDMLALTLIMGMALLVLALILWGQS